MDHQFSRTQIGGESPMPPEGQLGKGRGSQPPPKKTLVLYLQHHFSARFRLWVSSKAKIIQFMCQTLDLNFPPNQIMQDRSWAVQKSYGWGGSAERLLSQLWASYGAAERPLWGNYGAATGQVWGSYGQPWGSYGVGVGVDPRF